LFTPDARGAPRGGGGGGRYDGLVEQLGGPPTPGIGWAAGIERMLLAREGASSDGSGTDRDAHTRRGAHSPSGPPVALFLALAEPGSRVRRTAFGLLSQARSAGLAAQMELGRRSLKGQLGHADALGARYVAIVGAEETVLKDMQVGRQEQIRPDTVVHAVLRGLREL
jgi:histidyl-tRNA synthetase